MRSSPRLRIWLTSRRPSPLPEGSKNQGRDVTTFLHSMLRVSDPQATIDFFRLIGLEERRRRDVPQGKFTLIFLGAGDDVAEVELTHNWDEAGYDGGRNFGHLA